MAPTPVDRKPPVVLARRRGREAGRPAADPRLVVDSDAFDANADDLVRRCARQADRVASKSRRAPALIERALAHDGMSGSSAYSLREALWLHDQGISDDVAVVAYPTVDRAALAELVASPSAAAAITLMVDDVAHLDVVDSVRFSPVAVVRIAIDVDAGLHLAGRTVGPEALPLGDVGSVLGLAREVVARTSFRLVGAMTHEGQVAGIQDSARRTPGCAGRPAPGQVHVDPPAHGASPGGRRRARVPGGAGVLERWRLRGPSRETAADPVVTEVAGSGLPRADAVRPLPLVRAPPGVVLRIAGHPASPRRVVTGPRGGLTASGAAGARPAADAVGPGRARADRSGGRRRGPDPLVGLSADGLGIGDLVWFRHAKSGEGLPSTLAPCTCWPATSLVDAPCRPTAGVASSSGAASRAERSCRSRWPGRRRSAPAGWWRVDGPRARARRRWRRRSRAARATCGSCTPTRCTTAGDGLPDRRPASRRLGLLAAGDPGATAGTTGTAGRYAEKVVVPPAPVLVVEGVGAWVPALAGPGDRPGVGGGTGAGAPGLAVGRDGPAYEERLQQRARDEEDHFARTGAGPRRPGPARRRQVLGWRACSRPVVTSTRSRRAATARS